MPSPFSRPHSKAHSPTHGWLWLYSDLTPGCEAGLECTWVMGPEDVPQLDAFLLSLTECGGQSRLEGKYSAGAPELIVEVNGSSLLRDLGVKLDLYLRAGVRQYLTVLRQPRQVILRIREGGYEEIPPDADGLMRSRVFPGL